MNNIEKIPAAWQALLRPYPPYDLNPTRVLNQISELSSNVADKGRCMQLYVS